MAWSLSVDGEMATEMNREEEGRERSADGFCARVLGKRASERLQIGKEEGVEIS
jgi:hypothetical protein